MFGIFNHSTEIRKNFATLTEAMEYCKASKCQWVVYQKYAFGKKMKTISLFFYKALDVRYGGGFDFIAYKQSQHALFIPKD